MPFIVQNKKDVPPSKRRTKLMQIDELIEINKLLDKGLKPDQVIRLTFDAATLRKHFKNNAKKAAVAVAIRLRRERGDHFTISIADGVEVRIENKK